MRCFCLFLCVWKQPKVYVCFQKACGLVPCRYKALVLNLNIQVFKKIHFCANTWPEICKEFHLLFEAFCLTHTSSKPFKLSLSFIIILSESARSKSIPRKSLYRPQVEFAWSEWSAHYVVHSMYCNADCTCKRHRESPIRTWSFLLLFFYRLLLSNRFVHLLAKAFWTQCPSFLDAFVDRLSTIRCKLISKIFRLHRSHLSFSLRKPVEPSSNRLAPNQLAFYWPWSSPGSKTDATQSSLFKVVLESRIWTLVFADQKDRKKAQPFELIYERALAQLNLFNCFNELITA